MQEKTGFVRSFPASNPPVFRVMIYIAQNIGNGYLIFATIVAKSPDIWYTPRMNAHTKDGIPNLREMFELSVNTSILLSIEMKAALLQETEQGMDTERLSFAITLLNDEKRYMITYFQHLLKTDRFPKKVPDLMSNLRRDYFARIRNREAKEKLEFTESDILQTIDDLI